MDSKNGSMQALVLLGPDRFELQEVPIPQPSENEVLCKIHAVAICGSDPKFIHGEMKGTWPPVYPFIIGHEWAGEVVALGRQVKSLTIGKRVAGEAHSGCGFCPACKKGNYNLCVNYGKKDMGHRHYGHNSTGSYAQFGVFTERSLTPIPDGVTYAQAALTDAAGTGLHAIELTGITPGGTVVVIGPGPIGLIVAKLAKSFGASKVIIIGRGNRLQKAIACGSDYVIDFELQDAVSQVQELTCFLGADEVFECSGAKGTINQALQITKKGGKVGLLGIPSPKSIEEIDPRKLILDEIAIHGSRANPNVSGKILSMIASGRLYIDDLITHHFPLTEFSHALETFTSRKDGAMKVIIEPNAS